MDPRDSIDGFGMTFDDLSEQSQAKLIFRLLRSRQVSDEERTQIGSSLDHAKELTDKAQAKVRAAITPTTETQ